MLPPRLQWQDPRPIPRLDPQDPVTVTVCDPSFYAPDPADDCSAFWYTCMSHGRHYLRGACGDGPHLIALECTIHGLENMWPQPKMLLFPGGFTPQLGAGQLAEIQAASDEDESLPDDSRGRA
ncbi:hypothetical protein AB0D12_25450 [Streptomyces sp. NPDC048479]|uniref:hypothetical protein n=1 Tax=Streptomyces sp. NPDC048479 TaxID=3154725 RepID=UPI00343FBE20